MINLTRITGIMPMSGCSGLATMTAWATLTVACRAASLAGSLRLAYQAGHRLQASLSQLTNRILCPSRPQDRRCRGGGEADEFQGVQRRAQGTARVDQVINQMDRSPSGQALPNQAAIPDTRVVAVGDEVGLRHPPDQHGWHCKPERKGSSKSPGPLVTADDRMLGRHRASELVDDEGEGGRMTEYALEVGETTARVAFSILHLGVADTTKDNVPHAGRVSDVQPHSSTSPDTNSTRKPTLNRPNEHAYRTAPPCLAAGNTGSSASESGRLATRGVATSCPPERPLCR
jgi:hypothetical protein